ncbi:MAG: bifunctional tetrahydrofolate synthase/dihydrofolate synthase [Methylococcaceae bacterium]|nr:bifunctional tetrahydrofolate synthase/dihydrofolate synthase [Methylococcaceae bacterium]
MARFDSLDAWLNWQETLHPRPIDLGLERVAGVYRQLNPDRKSTPTVTVAGTNGKGSCIAFLEAIYRAQGYKVGAYTSPHIVRYNERIRVDGQPVSDDAICQAFTLIDTLRGDTSLSYFEFGTLAALNIFAAAGVDVQLLEVGLGGRLDAVNIVEPSAALVTTIAIDHVDWLGHTEEDIGREKAGIFRGGVPAIIGDPRPPNSLLEVALEKNACLMRIGQAFNYCKHEGGWNWRTGDLQLLDLPEPAFRGEHQYRNASAVLMAVTTLQPVLPVSDVAIRDGLQHAQLQGRFQLISGESPVLLDVGHNPQAVQTLVEYLRDEFPAVKIHAVFAMMKDKDIAGVLSVMRGHVEAWYLAPLKNPRAAGEELLRTYFQQQDIEKVNGGFADFSAAFNAARQNARQGELILVFGSFFLVSEYLSKFS